MNSDVCQCCGQRMLTRHGERFTIQESDILGMIEDVTKGRGGITMDSLITCFFPGQPRKQAAQRILSVVWSINEKLVSTDLRIAGPGSGNKDGIYKLINSEEQSNVNNTRQVRTRRRTLQRAYG